MSAVILHDVFIAHRSQSFSQPDLTPIVLYSALFYIGLLFSAYERSYFYPVRCWNLMLATIPHGVSHADVAAWSSALPEWGSRHIVVEPLMIPLRAPPRLRATSVAWVTRDARARARVATP